ncbi:SDR family NAD(P)-dependent oxidoreductase [Streptomyces sp. NPDC058001]|uniref:SDR family NAD(P)-dependent oxidoreductase n=1 Tax=Streptomyces sp. NPDC058001 TaxID=3346300 RepID=UPI0036EF45D4
MTVLDLFRIDGKVVMITGASSGLGVAFAQAMAEAGANVVLGARRTDRLHDTARLVEQAGHEAWRSRRTSATLSRAIRLSELRWSVSARSTSWSTTPG